LSLQTKVTLRRDAAFWCKPDYQGKEIPHTVLSDAITIPHLLWLPTVLAVYIVATQVCFVVNMPRYGYYSQARTAVQLDRYQKDSGAV
jgi:hypothetical protein